MEYLCDARFFPALDGHGNDSISEISFENEVAQVAGCFVVQLAAAQARRFMWMFGWPRKFVEALVDPSAAQSVFDEFRKDCQHFDLLCREACRSGLVAELYMQRHMMQKRCNQQNKLGCEEVGFTPDERLMDMLRTRFSTIMSSSVVEHLNIWQETANIPPTGAVVSAAPRRASQQAFAAKR